MDKQFKILIVEDEKPLARALEIKLKSEGFDVIIAYDGVKALSLIDGNKFDLILLDLLMPKLDGFAVLSALREKRDKTPVIVASNLGQEEEIQRAKSLGAVDYFIKSNITIADLIIKIQKFLGVA